MNEGAAAGTARPGALPGETCAPCSGTDTVAPDDRVDYWRHAMKDTLAVDCLVEPARPAAFDASMGVMRCGPVDLIEIAGAP